uniref:Geminin n=1 Tax=Clastoptera arizonana TaxID=38151 RepID=A0A1B6DBW0_9HEMI
MKETRKILQSLQKTAGDKENLVSAGRVPKDSSNKEIPNKMMKTVTENSTTVSHPKVHGKAKASKKITVEDLTSEDGPSEKYWEVLAERRRVALEKALQENQSLHERITLLEEEKAQYKALLEESNALVEVLKEVLSETNENGEEEEEGDSVGNTNENIIINRQ